MNPFAADGLKVDSLVRCVPRRRAFTLVLAVVLAMGGASPATAADELSGLQLARDFASRAVDLASNPAEIPDKTVTVPTQPPGDGEKGKGGDKGKGGGNDMGKGGDKGKSKGDSGNGNKPEKLTSRDRAAEAIDRALDRGNGNGFGRGHAADVIETIQAGGSPATLDPNENHGAQVSAMVAAYNQLKSQLGGDR